MIEEAKENDRVRLSAEFEVFTHGKGFQLRRNGNFYSIIPITKSHDIFGVKEIGWEVNNGQNRFDNLLSAIKYVLNQEDVSVEVLDIQTFYNNVGEVSPQ
jgi:hypothetical protein